MKITKARFGPGLPCGFMTIINLPTATSMLGYIAGYSLSWFDEFLPFVLAIAGIIIASLLLPWLGGAIVRAIRTLVSKGNRKPYHYLKLGDEWFPEEDN